MTDTPAEQSSTSWFHHPWAWLVFAIPLLTIVAGFITLYIANDGRDSLVSENYYREGLAINRQTDRLHRAAELGVTAELDFGRNQAYMQVILQHQEGSLPDSLLLNLHHPTLQERDQQIILERVDDSNRYQVVRPRITPGRWYVSLKPADNAWLLQSQIQLPIKGGTLNLTP